jgi:tRNA (mo5U34)-methyltransferase
MKQFYTLFDDFFHEIATNRMQSLAKPSKKAISLRLDDYTHGLLESWLSVLSTLPNLQSKIINLKDKVSIGEDNILTLEYKQKLIHQLMKLHPWRKGPYFIHGIHIDTEWRSDWKWQRIIKHIHPLKERYVLDIGCGNGYHCWRMYGEGAKFVLGIDPSQLFLMQFNTIKHFIGKIPVHLLPIGIEYMPMGFSQFDTVFSMGVFYHRKSPFEHLAQCRSLLREKGELVLETLVIDGDINTVLIPKDRYSLMPNVWFIPSALALESWLVRTGFKNVHIVDINQTCTKEQRTTSWMNYHSLSDFLDPSNSDKTKEGYPAPKRAVILAER